MSNELAIAQATQALRTMLNREAAATLGVEVNVQVGRPPTDPPTDRPTINVFCYHVTPNGEMRNYDVPTRNAQGTVIRRPQAAIDLHYLLSCYGAENDLWPQMLMGVIVRALHEQPMLSRDDLEEAATQPLLGGANLVASPQRIRLTPTKMDIDDLSKLWSMFSDTPYAPSIAYEATLVFLDGNETPRAGLPVLTHQVRVIPGRRPVIEQLRTRPQGSADEPVSGPVPVGNEVVLDGRHFIGEPPRVRIGDLELDAQRIEAGRLIFVPPAQLEAGVHPVRVLTPIRFQNDTVRTLDSTARAMGRQARVTGTTATANTLIAQLDLNVGAEQRASLLLDELDSTVDPPRSYQFDADFPLPGGRAPNEIPFEIDLEPGSYLIRVEIDGVASRVDDDLREPHIEIT